jgi:hypothetical protein
MPPLLPFILNRSPGTKIPDLMLDALLIGEPFGAKQLLGLMPMLKRAALGTALSFPDRAREGFDFPLLPGFHNESIYPARKPFQTP